MFKKFGFVAIVVCLAFSMCMQTFARTYVDSMVSVISDNITSYVNLDVHSFANPSAHILPDDTTLAISGNEYIGHVTYRVTGATSLSASIYSQAGTFVSLHPEKPSTYMLGVFQDNMNFLSSQNVSQALFCRATDAVYTYDGGLKQKYTDMSTYFFGPVITPPSGELVGYGVSFYFSYDGINYIYAAATQTGLQFDVREMFCYETYSTAVPAIAKYVRVEINDISAVPVSGGGTYPKDKRLSTKLASVTISGDELTLGEPEIPISIPVERPSSSSSRKYYDDDDDDDDDESEKPASSSSGAPVDTVPIAEPSSKAEKSSSQKFEGTITASSSSKNERPSSSKPEASIEKNEEPALKNISHSEAAPSRDEAVVYEIARGNTESSTADTAINGFIISMSGAIVLRLITMGVKK